MTKYELALELIRRLEINRVLGHAKRRMTQTDQQSTTALWGLWYDQEGNR